MTCIAMKLKENNLHFFPIFFYIHFLDPLIVDGGFLATYSELNSGPDSD